MYESYFGLREKPFSLLPDPHFLYLSRKHRLALAMLEYSLVNEAAGFSVLTGEVGSGKTTLVRQLLNQMGEHVSVGLVTHTHSAFGALMQWVLLAYGLDYKDKSNLEMYEVFVDFVIQEYARNRHTVLIIDEAQNLSCQQLEELRMLSNVNADKDRVFQLLLVGQPELRNTLLDPELEQFVQRVSANYHIESLDSSETREYIRHRLRVAGGDPDTFTGPATDAVWYHSGGIPRLINVICDTALVYGFAEQVPNIDVRLVRDVVKERELGGLFGNRGVHEQRADAVATAGPRPAPDVGSK